jgi:hypothetical protein
MEQVNRVAVYLAQRLQEVGKPVILNLVDRASLLHDTLRVTEWNTLSFEYFPEPPSSEEIHTWELQRQSTPTHIPHAHVTADIFHDRYPELAQVIRLHSLGDAVNVRTWEEKIVNYADRRVSHDRIVTVQERLDEAYARYSKVQTFALERDPRVLSALIAIEHEIFDAIGEDPNDLLANMEHYEAKHSQITNTTSSHSEATE